MKKKAKCTCIKQVNKHLERDGVRIKQQIEIDFKKGKSGLSGPCIATEKIPGVKRAKPVVITCSFCPFCGVKLTEDEPKPKQPSKTKSTDSSPEKDS